MSSRAAQPLGLRSQLWIDAGGTGFLGRRRVALLEAIDATGSLTAAARRVGVSYKCSLLQRAVERSIELIAARINQ